VSINFLILHNMGSRLRWLASVADIELALPRYAPEHQYLVHNASLPIPEFIKDIRYDAIIVNSTFIELLGTPRGFEKIKKDYAFIKNNPAFTIALPQDDYWCSEVRDEWFTEFGIKRVHPVCSKEHWGIFYPRYMASGREISQGYTGYITPKLRQRAAFPKSYDLRRYNVVYRAKDRPGYPNRIGNLKGQIGARFALAFVDQPLLLDISTNPKDAITGDGWLDFVENSKAMIGSNSGSSLLVRNHKMALKVLEFMLKYPKAPYEEIEQACFPGEDGRHEFTAISPRNFEAGLLNTLQLLVPGPYSNILSQYEHYFPLTEDCSNKHEVMTVLKDMNEQTKIAGRCRDALLSCEAIQVESFVNEIVSSISHGLPANHKSMASEQFLEIIHRHKNATSINEKYLDAIESVKQFAIKTLPSSVINDIKRLRKKYL